MVLGAMLAAFRAAKEKKSSKGKDKGTEKGKDKKATKSNEDAAKGTI